MSSSLQSILGHLPAAQFLADYYHRLPYSATGKAAALCELGTWDVLVKILAQPDADTLVCRRNERFAGSPPRSIEEAQKLVEEGHTLLVRHAERHDDRLAELAAGFAADLGGAVNIHMYCTPNDQFGFGWHYDAEEVFIVQTTGRKEYLLRKNTVNPWPVEETLPRDMHYEREIMPLMRCELAAGDWLYIPSGYWHMGQSHETAISLAIGVQPRTAIDLFDFLRQRILDSLLWRQRLPVAGAANPQSRQELATILESLIPQLVKDFARQLVDPRMTEDFIDYLHADLSLALYREAETAVRQGNDAAAISFLLQSASAADHFKTRELLGECLERMGQLAEALEQFQRAVRLNPESNKSAALLAALLVRLDRREEATAIALDVIARSPTYGPAHKVMQELGHVSRSPERMP